jgi:hypothetical protein
VSSYTPTGGPKASTPGKRPNMPTFLTALSVLALLLPLVAATFSQGKISPRGYSITVRHIHP